MATGRNRKKTSWINPFKRLPVQSTTPQPPLQELCKTTSCSANSTRVCGNIPELNYPQHQKFFPNLLPMLLLLELKPITHPTLCHFSLHQPCTYLATCSVSAQTPLQITHFSQVFYTSSHSLCTSSGFSQLSHMFPEVWKSSLSQDHCQVEWRGCPMSSAVCAPQNRHPRRTAGFLQHWVSTVLPSITVLDFSPHGRSLANCS